MVLFKIGAMGGGVGVPGSMVGLLDVVGIIFVSLTFFLLTLINMTSLDLVWSLVNFSHNMHFLNSSVSLL